MKTILKKISAVLFFTALSLSGYSQGKITLKIEINDLKSDKGKVMISITDSNMKTISEKTAIISDGLCIVVFDSLSAEIYAVSYLHDKNLNKTMDYGSMGIPAEGYGYSNNARGFMGPPDIEDQLFEFKKDTTLDLRTKYW